MTTSDSRRWWVLAVLCLTLFLTVLDNTVVTSAIQKLVKLIESGDADRPVPIVSFISRQRDRSASSRGC